MDNKIFSLNKISRLLFASQLFVTEITSLLLRISFWYILWFFLPHEKEDTITEEKGTLIPNKASSYSRHKSFSEGGEDPKKLGWQKIISLFPHLVILHLNLESPKKYPWNSLSGMIVYPFNRISRGLMSAIFVTILSRQSQKSEQYTWSLTKRLTKINYERLRDRWVNVIRKGAAGQASRSMKRPL